MQVIQALKGILDTEWTDLCAAAAGGLAHKCAAIGSHHPDDDDGDGGQHSSSSYRGWSREELCCQDHPLQKFAQVGLS